MRNFKNIVIIEDHSIIGGLNEIVKSNAFDFKYSGKIFSFALQDKFINNYKSQDDLLNSHGLSDQTIIKKIIEDLD